MSWVKEAFRKGDEERSHAAEKQKAEELAQQRESLERAQTQENAKRQTERDKQEELVWLKRRLDERGVKDLLRDIQREIGGEIIFKSTPSHEMEHTSTLWAAYGLVKSEVGRTEHHHTGGNTTQESHTNPESGRTHYTDRHHEFFRFSKTPITTTRIGFGAFRFRFGSIDKEEFYLKTGRRVYNKIVTDVYANSHNGEIPFALRFLPSIPGIIKQEISFDHEEGNDYTLDDNIYRRGNSEKILLPNGKFKPEVFELEPGLIKTEADIGDNPTEDRERIRELLAEGLRKI